MIRTKTVTFYNSTNINKTSDPLSLQIIGHKNTPLKLLMEIQILAFDRHKNIA